jgi:hypothetical protein
MENICEFCNLVVKDKYILRNHLKINKKCLKIRGLSLETEFICIGCNSNFINNNSLLNHHQLCRNYIIKITKDECIENYEKENKKCKDKYEKKLKEQKDNYEKEIKELKNEKYKININHKAELELEKINGKMVELKSYLSSLEKQNEKLHEMVREFTLKAIDKPTTSNTTYNNIRNKISDKYFLEELKPDYIKRKCESFFNEKVFMEGQRGIARLCNEHIINTNDDKKLLISTDKNRGVFKYSDKNGNIKEDIGGRVLIDKINRPIQDFAKIVYDGIVSDINSEKETIEEDDYSKKSSLNDKELQACNSLVEIKCIDDPKTNSEFINELSILNRQ